MENLREQLRRFGQLKTAVGEPLAHFYTCVAFDIPFVPEAAPEDGGWRRYLENLADILPEWESRGFSQGETDVRQVLRAGAGQMERWRNTWGDGLTAGQYERLDALFATYSSRLQRAGGMDAQQEDTLRSCSRMRLQADQALAKGDKESIDIAAKLNKMIQDNLASENLRKKDERPVEELRIDSIVEALEKAGMMENGKLLPLPELQRALLERLGALGGKPSHKYAYTLDAADQMIHIIINTMRGNDGLGEMVEFLDNTTLDQNVACEFLPMPDEDELSAYEALGLERMDRRKKKTKTQ